MSTDTEDLIGKLTAELKPVRPVAPVWQRAAVLTVLALGAVFGLIFAFTQGLRPDWRYMLSLHSCQVGAIFLAGVLAAFAAFTLSVPDTKIRPHVTAMIGLASTLWGVIILQEVLAGWPLTTSVAERNCLTDFSMLLVLPFAAGIFMAARGAPVWRGWAGYSVTLSAASFAALGMRFLCPSEEPGHLLVWHFLPVVVFALFGSLFGEILLKWKVAKI